MMGGCLEPSGGYAYPNLRDADSVGILIDLSHARDKTTMESIRASRERVTFTRANPRAMPDISP
jgi:microsomal dipeptidase-like Zn-dependent dipeptidase